LLFVSKIELIHIDTHSFTWNTAQKTVYSPQLKGVGTLIKKEIQMGAVANSSMKKGFLIYEEMRKYLVMRRPLVIYDFATGPFWISLYTRKILFSFLSVYRC
jgi:hypothetical protein